MIDIDTNNIKKLDGSLLLVFRELLRQRQTTGAARALGLSQSAISHALTRLRELFGDPLFTRLPHGLKPTRRALELAPRIDALIDMANETLAGDGAFDPAHSQRRFRVAAPEFVTAVMGGALINLLRKAAPGVSFNVQHLPDAVALDNLRRNAIDMALGRFLAVPPGFARTLLYEDRHCVVARRGHPRLKGKKKISLGEYTQIGHVYAGAPAEISSDEIHPSPRATAMFALVPQWLTVLAMVSTTDALGTVPRRLAERQAGALKLQVLAEPFGWPAWPVHAVRRADDADVGTDWFLDQVREAVT